jgi:hypothetical protein
MQVTMFAVLLATLGFGALLARSRERATAVHLTDKPFLTDRLALRYPRGWDLRQESDDAPVRVLEPRKVGGGGSEPRVLILQQGKAPGGTAEALLTHHMASVQGKLGALETFDMLGQTGVLAPFELFEQISEAEIQRVPGWYAAAVVPGAGADGGDLGVVLAVRGPAAAGPAGSQLLRQVADGLSLRRR